MALVVLAWCWCWWVVCGVWLLVVCGVGASSAVRRVLCVVLSRRAMIRLLHVLLALPTLRALPVAEIKALYRGDSALPEGLTMVRFLLR